MRLPLRSVIQPIIRHFLAVFVTLLMTGFLYLLQDYLNSSTVALIYLIPVLISTTVWGLSSGLIAGFFAFLTLNYFFILPYYTLQVLHTQDIIALAIFFLVAVITSQLVGRARQNLDAAKIKETEITQLYELSLRLVGVNSLPEIAFALAQQTRNTFRAAHIKVEISSTPVQTAFEVSAPPLTSPPLGKPQAIMPIQTSWGLLGELQLWRESHLDSSEQQMLKTFATQGALALERATYLHSETRAQVLEESDKLKSALLSSVSHELRTPLATIKAAATSLLSGDVDWDQAVVRQELLEVVDEETDHLNRLVGNLLDMSRIEAGALKPDRQWNTLTEIVEGANARMRRALEQHQVVSDIPENLPLIPVDYYQLERVFTNLLSNSIKFAPPDTTIQIRARMQDEETIRVQVVNQGPPVPPEHLPRIFDKFQRVTDADRVTGTGLGLSICKGIIEAHEGHIWAENLPDGFAFFFELPVTWNGRPPPAIPSETA